MNEIHIPVPIILDITISVNVTEDGRQHLVVSGSELSINHDQIAQAVERLAPKEERKVDLGRVSLVCEAPGCKKTFDTIQGFNIHKARMHKLPQEPSDQVGVFQPPKTSPPPAPVAGRIQSTFSPASEKPLNVTYITCANSDCTRLQRFVKGAGYTINGKEYCNQRCWQESFNQV